VAWIRADRRRYLKTRRARERPIFDRTSVEIKRGRVSHQRPNQRPGASSLARLIDLHALMLSHAIPHRFHIVLQERQRTDVLSVDPLVGQRRDLQTNESPAAIDCGT